MTLVPVSSDNYELMLSSSSSIFGCVSIPAASGTPVKRTAFQHSRCKIRVSLASATTAGDAATTAQTYKPGWSPGVCACSNSDIRPPTPNPKTTHTTLTTLCRHATAPSAWHSDHHNGCQQCPSAQRPASNPSS